MTTNQSNSDNPRLNLEYRKKRNAEDMKMQVISFAMMLFLTLIAFFAVYQEFSGWYIIQIGRAHV